MFSYDVDAGEMFIYDEIGPSWWGLIDAESVISALNEMDGKHVKVRLNTPGGSVDQGVAIFNALKRHKGGVTTIADSLAASMGSYILQAGAERKIASNAMVMIHNPWTITYGDAAALRKEADILDKYAERMLPDYARRSGKSEEEVQSIMAAETWYTGQEAIDAGFADSLDAEVGAVAAVVGGLRGFAKHVPAALGPGLQAGDRTKVERSIKQRSRLMTAAEGRKLVAHVDAMLKG